MDDAAKTWTAPAEGQTTKTKPNDQAQTGPATTGSGDGRSESARADAPGQDRSTEVRADAPGQSRAARSDQADQAAAADESGAAIAADEPAVADDNTVVLGADVVTDMSAMLTAGTTVLVDPSVLANFQTAAPAAAAIAIADMDPATVQVAVDVTAAAASVAAGAPVDPAAPGVAELLASIDAGQTDVQDLPADVQALVAKATAAQVATAQQAADTTASTPATAAGTAPTVDSASTTPVAAATGAAVPTDAAPTSPNGAAVPAEAPATPVATAPQPTAATAATPASAASAEATDAATVLAAAAADGSAQPTTSDAPSADAKPMSPLAAAIQAVATQTAGGGQQGDAPAQGQTPDGSAAAAAIAAPVTGAAPAEATPVDAAQVAPSPITVAPASGPVQSTVAAPATPTISAATPGAQTAAIEALVHLSRNRGHSSARIALAPEQLGGIQVTLIFGADGVTARMIADRPEAAAALQRAGQDLKDSLQQQGIELAGLETGFAGDTGKRQSERGSLAEQAAAHQHGNRTEHHTGGETTLHLAMAEPAHQPLVPGRLIDLHA